jgi:hypothetical protein
VAAYQSPYYGTGRHSQFGLFDNKNAEVRRLWNSDKRRIWNSLTHSDNDQGDIGTWYAEPFHCSESGDDAGMSCCGPVSPVR